MSVPRGALIVLLLGMTWAVWSERCWGEKPQEVYRLLHELPPWPMASLAGVDDAEQRVHLDADAAKITLAVAELDTFSLDDIRAGLVRYESSNRYQPAMAFAVIQYLFELPDARDPKSRYVRTVYKTLHPTGLELAPSWPWRRNAHGRMQFEVLPVALIRYGPPFRPIPMFDQYRKHFGRRRPPAHHKK